MTTPNTFPAPIGVTVSFTQLAAGVTTAPFTWTEPGLYTISLEFHDATNSTTNNPSSCTFQLSGSATPLLTMERSGYYSFIVPPLGGGAYTFTAVSPVRNARMTRMF